MSDVYAAFKWNCDYDRGSRVREMLGFPVASRHENTAARQRRYVTVTNLGTGNVGNAKA